MLVKKENDRARKQLLATKNEIFFYLSDAQFILSSFILQLFLVLGPFRAFNSNYWEDRI